MSGLVGERRIIVPLLVALVWLGGCESLANKLVHRPETMAAVEHATTLPSSTTQPLAKVFATSVPSTAESADGDRQIRVNVGPPPATLSVAIFDPPASTTAPAALPRGTIIVLHGITSVKEVMREYGDHFADAGYRAVLVDLRGHGASTGDYLSYGVFESRDLVQLLNELARRGDLVGPVGVYGHSYGGAIALQFAAKDPRVRAVVVSSAFTSMRDVVPHIVMMFTPWMLRPFELFAIQPTITRAGEIAGFNPDDADALAAIQKTDAHVLIIHAKGDSFIPYRHAQRLHDAAPSHSKLVLLEGEDHNSVLFDPLAAQTADEAVEWFNRWLH